jgi:hypothetical protein
MISGHTAQYDFKFRQAFRRAWRRIPLADRRSLLAYWREAKPYGGLPSPRIVVTLGQPKTKNRARALALCRLCGHGLQFWAAAVELEDLPVLEVVIAHELAHVVLWARREHTSHVPSMERRVAAQHRTWGFDLADVVKGSPDECRSAYRRWRGRMDKRLTFLDDALLSWFVSEHLADP